MKKIIVMAAAVLAGFFSAGNAEAQNTLTAQEAAEGWNLLWDGHTTNGWRGAKLDAFPAKGWRIEDGLLKVEKGNGGESTNGGDIVTVRKYRNFILKVDFKITEAVKDKEDVLIRTYIDYRGSDGKNSQFLVEFRVHKKDGRIMLTDIKVAESSLILSYRNRFYQMIADADEEIDWFLEDFELLTDSSEQGYLRVEDGGVKNRQNKRLVKILETVAASFGDFYFSPKFHQKSKVRQKNIL